MKKVPILLIAWKRPSKVQRVIRSIKEYKPTDIYVFCDGFQKENDLVNQKILDTRKTIDLEINWECKINKKYLPTNNGCKVAVSTAINWFFLNVEEGIILEDDCLPDISFYYFCEKLLKKYKNKKRIFTISGNNFQDGIVRGNGSYYFSIYTHIWGWATWKDRWKLYDIDIKKYLEFEKNKNLNKFFEIKKEQIYWKKIFHTLFHKKRPNTWDYQLFFASLFNNKLNIIPNTSLVENIGFDSDSTHNFFEDATKQTKIDYEILKSVQKLKDPTKFSRDIIADNYTFKNHYYNFLIKRIKLKIKKFFK